MKKPKEYVKKLKIEIKDDVIYSDLFMAFYLFSIAILLLGSIFQIPGIVAHPQFDSYSDSQLIEHLIKNDTSGWLDFSYYGYFVLDFIWPILLLLVVYKILYNRCEVDSEQFNRKMLSDAVVLMCLAYAYDVAENVNYLVKYSYNSFLAYTKIGLYASVFLMLIFSYLNYLTNDFLPTLWIFIRSAVFSLLVLLIIGVLLPTAPQVNSIVVDLYLLPYNMIILLVILAPFFSIVIAHYPSYFNNRNGRRDWFMAKTSLFKLIGIIYYRNKDYDKVDKVNTGTLNYLYRVLGICFYSALFYMISFTSEVNFGWKLQMSKLTFALFISGVFLLYFLMNIKSTWYSHYSEYIRSRMTQFYDGDYISPSDRKKDRIKFPLPDWLEKYLMPENSNDSDTAPISRNLRTINIPVMGYLILFSITVIFHIVFFIKIVLAEEKYTEEIAVLSLIAIALQMLTFIFYRAFRSLLRLVLFNKCSRSIINGFLEDPEVNDYDCNASENVVPHPKVQEVIKFFEDYDFSKDSWFLGFFKKLRFGAFSNNILFLQMNAFIGIANLVFLIIINSVSWWATMFSTIIIILSVLYFLYGILVVLTKNWVFHAAEEKKKEPEGGGSSNAFKKLVFISLTLVLVLSIITQNIGNDLFTLKPVKRSEDKEITAERFISALDPLNTRYYIGCYGGGMKSNAWTMTVLNELYGRDSAIFHNTIGISGVSGGTMGMVNFYSILDNYPNNDSLTKSDRASLIKKVSTENILSMDITHATGRDLLNYLFNPTKASGFDRATKVMERYATLTEGKCSDQEGRSTFRENWNHLYRSSDSSFPIFIANTTNVRGNQGMAVSVKTANADLDSLLYRGSDNILEIYRTDLGEKTDEFTLGYYEAASTSNRFPLLSPAAKIETKGHYNDGGIFENSGLYPVYKLFQTVNEKENVKDLDALKQRNVFVCIINDKNLYIKQVVQDSLSRKNDSLLVDEVNYNSELDAIIKSVASTEMTPTAIKSELERLSNRHDCIEYVPIYLPHTFTVADVKAIYGKKLRLRSGKSADSLIYTIALNNNVQIKRTYQEQVNKTGQEQDGKLPIIEPPMSRVMAEPAYDFMSSMLCYDMTEAAMDSVIAKGNFR